MRWPLFLLVHFLHKRCAARGVPLSPQKTHTAQALAKPDITLDARLLLQRNSHTSRSHQPAAEHPEPRCCGCLRSGSSGAGYHLQSQGRNLQPVSDEPRELVFRFGCCTICDLTLTYLPRDHHAIYQHPNLRIHCPTKSRLFRLGRDGLPDGWPPGNSRSSGQCV